MDRPRRGRTLPVWAVIVLAVVGLSVVRLSTGVLTEAPESRDGAGYVSIAFGLVREGQFAFAGAAPGELTMYREPFPVWVKAAQLRLDPRARSIENADLIWAVGGPDARLLRQLNVVWASLLLLGVAIQVRLSLQAYTRWRTFWMVGAMFATHALLLEQRDVMDRTLSELPAAVLIVWAGVVATCVVRTGKARWGALLGVLLGLLVLTRASFLYVSVAFLVLLIIIGMTNGKVTAPSLSRTAVAVISAAAVSALIVAPWIVRNERAFGVAAVSESSGLALHHRIVYNTANKAELRGMWFYFAPGPLQRTVLGPALGISMADFEEGRPLRRLHRFSEEVEPDDAPWSFYQQARLDRREVRAYVRTELVPAGLVEPYQVTARADQILLERSLVTAREAPLLFLRTTPAFLWRGTWVIDQSLLLPRWVFAPFNLLGMATLLGAALFGLFRRRLEIFALSALPAGGVLLNALVTIFEPRHTRVAVPTMIVILTLVIARTAAAWNQRRERRTGRREGLPS